MNQPQNLNDAGFDCLFVGGDAAVPLILCVRACIEIVQLLSNFFLLNIFDEIALDCAAISKQPIVNSYLFIYGISTFLIIFNESQSAGQWSG